MYTTRRDTFLMAGTLAAGQMVSGSARPFTTKRAGGFQAVAFDAFTIFNILSVDAVIEKVLPGRGKTLGAAWRTKQFEYTWLRTLTNTYVDFWRVTADALAYATKAEDIALTADEHDALMNAYLKLDVWPEALTALYTMRAAGLRLLYLSNMTTDMMSINSKRSGLDHLFEHTLSTDSVRAFKPDARAYQMAETALRLPRDRILFAAFGGWDAAGARSFGFETFWVNRFASPIEELGIIPNAAGATLSELGKYAVR